VPCAVSIARLDKHGHKSTTEVAAVTLLIVDDAYLMDLVRCTGALVALVASFLAAPEATRHFWARLRMQAVTTGRTVQVQAERVWLKMRGRGPAPQSVALAPATINLTGSVTATGTLTLTVNRAGPLTERVERLEQHIETLNKLHDANRQAIAKETADRQEMVQRVSSKIGQEAAAIRSEITAMEQNALLVDARAVPVIGLGIVLTSIPDLIAKSAELGGLLIAAALTFLTWAWAHFWASGPAGEGSQSASRR
jgi:hypothetical protein